MSRKKLSPAAQHAQNIRDGLVSGHRQKPTLNEAIGVVLAAGLGIEVKVEHLIPNPGEGDDRVIVYAV